MTTAFDQTIKLYRQFSYDTHFAANVLDVKTLPDDRLEALFDRTLFYPTAGGQAHDTGVVDSETGARFRVVSVREDKNAGLVLHTLESMGLERYTLRIGEGVEGRINWERRFDLMQQHTGEHVLGQAFYRLGAHVVAVNMEREVCTLDLSETLEDHAILEAERIANQAIWAAHAVQCYEIPEDEIPNVPLRRATKVTGLVRVVQIGAFDYSACGGTHLASSSEVGLLKIVRLERIKGNLTRVHFLCGARALTDYTEKHVALTQLAQGFSTSTQAVAERVAGMQQELLHHKREGQRLRQDLAATLAEQWFAKTKTVFLELEDEALMLEAAKHIATQTGRVAVLACAQPARVQLVVACGPASGQDAAQLLKLGLAALDGKGGGKPELAQGTANTPLGAAPAFAAIRQVLGV